MDVLRLRTLTKLSRHKFGYEENKDLSIQELLDLKKHGVIIKAYFGLDRINYTGDILNEVGISENQRIDKPGKLKGENRKDAIKLAYKTLYSDKSENQRMGASSAAKKVRRIFSAKANRDTGRRSSRNYLKNRNQGNF
jgi:hypothetical protein